MKTLGWCFVGSLVVLLLILAFGCVKAPLPFPFPLTADVTQYVVQQAVAECGDYTLLVSFLTKDDQHYILVASELDSNGTARWRLLRISSDAADYLWEGTATPGHATVTGGQVVTTVPDWCVVLAPRSSA